MLFFQSADDIVQNHGGFVSLTFFLIIPQTKRSLEVGGLPFIYNKIYIKELLEAGWIPGDDMSRDALRTHGLPVPE
ncbi:MAG: hypothetical protein PUD16_14230 [bacterium]|nr:hypothetical protein [bacterium]